MMNDKSYKRIIIVLIEKNLPNKYHAENWAVDMQPFQNGLQTPHNLH